MKTLIINGSPRPQGNTAALIAQLKSRLEGEKKEAAPAPKAAVPTPQQPVQSVLQQQSDAQVRVLYVEDLTI